MGLASLPLPAAGPLSLFPTTFGTGRSIVPVRRSPAGVAVYSRKASETDPRASRSRVLNESANDSAGGPLLDPPRACSEGILQRSSTKEKMAALGQAGTRPTSLRLAILQRATSYQRACRTSSYFADYSLVLTTIPCLLSHSGL